MGIEEKLTEIIPPNDRIHREGFSNHTLIEKLNKNEKKEIEDALISMLYSTSDDVLIIETLAYIKSEKAIPALLNSLGKCNIKLQKVIIAVSIFKIYPNNKMIDVAIDSVNQIDDDRDLLFVFSYLKEFESERINNVIRNYINHSDSLVSYNAKRAIGMV